MIKPNEIESKEFKKVALGYSPEEVDEFLDQLMLDYGKLYKDNIELNDKIGILNESVDYYRSVEKTLQNTLLLAEKTAEETKAVAEQRAVQIEKEAKLQAEDYMRAAKNEMFRLEQEIDKLKNQYELMRTRVKLLLYAEIELIDKNDIFAKKEEESKEKEKSDKTA